MFRRWLLRILPLQTCILLMASMSSVRVAGQPSSTTPSEPPRVLLQVVNRHFTVGKKIPSTYLKVLSDGTVQCEAIDNREVGAVRKAQLSPSELAQITSVLNEPGLRDLGHSYALRRVVFDSWMEWDITINRSSPPPQNITLAFAGGPGYPKLPDALTKLGCKILELRRSVYGQDEAYYNPACSGF